MSNSDKVYKSERSANASVNSNTGLQVKSSKSNFSIVFRVLLLVLVITLFIRFATGSDTMPTFSSFLDMLSRVKPISYNFFNIPFLSGDWGILDFLREVFATSFGVFGFILNGIYTGLQLVFYFTTWLFA